MSDEHEDARPPADEVTTAAGEAPGGEPTAGAEQAPGGDPISGENPPRRRSRAVLARGWRPALAVAAVAALAWGTTAVEGSVRLGSAGTDRSDGTDDGPRETAFVEAAALACPGPEPLLGVEGAEPDVEVLAAGAPRSVLDAVPPARPAVEDRASSTDDGASTRGPDDAVRTSGPDDGASTEGPDDAATTEAPDDAATTEAPDDAATSEAPDAAATTQDPSDEALTGDSVLRTTDGKVVEELLHGIPVAASLEGPTSAVVTALRETAPAVVGGLLASGSVSGARGATVAGCDAAAETSWLVGGDDAPGRTEQLVLTNPGPDPVTVEVAVWGSEGQVTTTGAGAVVVPAGGRTVETLDALAAGVDAPVVRVRASGGPVVAHLAEYYRDGTTDRGAEIVSAATAPATDLVVPALPAVPEDHAAQVVLRVAAPGDAEAVVDLTALTTEGAVRLADQVTRVPAGSTVDVVLDDLPEGAVALRLRSDEPVVAGARLEVLPSDDEPVVLPGDDPGPGSAAGEPKEDADEESEEDESGPAQAEPLVRPAGAIAWVAGTLPSTTPTGMALPDRSLVPDGSAELALTAVDGTTAWVTWVDGEGEETARWVDLSNDTTVVLTVPEEARAVWVVGAGPAGVAAAVHVAGADELGPYLASATLPQVPWQRRLTEVRPAFP